MPHEEKPTLVELDTAHAYGFRPLRPINSKRNTHYVRVTRHKRTKRVLVEILPDDLLARARPALPGTVVREWWTDEHYVMKLLALSAEGEWSKARRFRSSSKGKMEPVKR